MASPLTVVLEAGALAVATVLGALGSALARRLRRRSKPRAFLPPTSPDATIPPVSLPVRATSRPSGEAHLPRVLIVDDEASYAKLLRRILTHADHGLLVEVDVAHTPEDALALARAHAYRVVIVDLGLPGGSGLDLLPRLRARTVIYSGAPDESLDALRRDGAADRVLAKGGEAEELIAAVRALL